MKRTRLSRWLAVLTLAIALASGIASVLKADTLNISGPFHMDQLSGTVGADLAEVFAHQNEHTWSLTLYGITYSHDEYYVEWNDEGGYGYIEELYTGVHATSFDFQFFGPDAIVLNEVISQQLIGGDAFLSLVNEDSFDSLDFFGGGRQTSWYFGLRPFDLAGVSIRARGSSGLLFSPNPSRYSADENGYPVVAPQRLYGDTYIYDERPGSYGELSSYDYFVEIEAPILRLPGDYNSNGIVDAADYTVWRDQVGNSTSLPNDDTAGVGPDDYDRWKLHFGQLIGGDGSGSGAALPSAAPLSAVVPEPTSLALLALGQPLLGWRNSRRSGTGRMRGGPADSY